MPPAALISSTAMHGADAALLARIGQCAGHRVQHADLHAGALRAQHGGCGNAASAAAMAPHVVPARKRRRLSGVSCSDMVTFLAERRRRRLSLPACSRCSIRLRGMVFFSIQDRPPSTSPLPRGTSSRMNEPLTLIDKLWSAHEIARREDGAALLWVDRHYVHEGSFHCLQRDASARGHGCRAGPDLRASPTTTCRPATAAAPYRRPRDRGMVSHDLEAKAAANQHQAVRSRRSAPGHRPCGRPRARADAARACSSSAATAIPRPTARSAPTPSASARRRWRTC